MEHRLPVVAVIALVLACASTAHASTLLTLNLTRVTANTGVPDAAGAWGFDGGTVSFQGTVIGRYARVLRTVLSGGTDPLNTAMVTMTLFLTGANPPQNLTLQGSHSFSDGEERGSISGASSTFRGAVGITFELAQTSTTTMNLTFEIP